MGICVCMGALCACSFGIAPTPLVTIPSHKTFTTLPAATIMDNKPFVNVIPFGMCQSLSNPMVIAATVAAFGVLTPMPCTPMTTAPWAPGCPTVLIGGNPALNNSSKLICNFGGVISISNPGQNKTLIP